MRPSSSRHLGGPGGGRRRRCGPGGDSGRTRDPAGAGNAASKSVRARFLATPTFSGARSTLPDRPAFQLTAHRSALPSPGGPRHRPLESRRIVGASATRYSRPMGVREGEPQPLHERAATAPSAAEPVPRAAHQPFHLDGTMRARNTNVPGLRPDLARVSRAGGWSAPAVGWPRPHPWRPPATAGSARHRVQEQPPEPQLTGQIRVPRKGAGLAAGSFAGTESHTATLPIQTGV